MMHLFIKRNLLWLTIFIQSIFIYPVFAMDEWVAVQDISLEIAPQSILDFSNITQTKPIQRRVIVNQKGRFAYEDQPNQPIRFLIGSLGFGVSLGGFPNHQLTDQYIKQYRMHGYNMVRLDFVEAMLMEGRKSDFDYDPEQLDRFHYLVSALKQNGIYLILNGLSNDNGGYGNINERWIGKKGLHQGVYFDAEKQQHWKTLIATMYGKVNPYTGMSVLKDPTLAGMILVNEGNLVFLNRMGADPSLKPQFSKWLKLKYKNNQTLKSAWGRELSQDEDMERANIRFPAPDAWTSKRMADTQQFFLETEKNTARWMTQYLRTQGYRGLVTSYNVWHSPQAQASRSQFNWVDMHNYFAHPEYMDRNQIKVRQDSMLANGAGYIRELASAKHTGKAYTVTEHGQVFWNQYRRENGLALPAYAALQNWDAICQHSGAVDLSYAPTLGRKTFINPFAVGTDPIARATETLAALLFLRGDVSPANHSINVRFDAPDAFDKSAHLGNTPKDISNLSLVTGVSLDWQGKASLRKDNISHDGEMQMNELGLKVIKQGVAKTVNTSNHFGAKVDRFIKSHASSLAYKLQKVNFIANDKWATRVQSLRDANFISENNVTDASLGLFHSDTDEILLDTEKKQLIVITDKTEAVVFDQPEPIVLKELSILSAERPALVAVSAMDNQSLIKSQRMLIVLSTDARNSNMKFSNVEQTVASDLGTSPVRILSNKVKLALNTPFKDRLKVYSLNLKGQRKDLINYQKTSSGITFELDISKLSHGATTYFEIGL